MSTNLLEKLIARETAARTAAAAEAAAAKEVDRAQRQAAARLILQRTLAPAVWRALGVELDELSAGESAVYGAGEFEIGGITMECAITVNDLTGRVSSVTLTAGVIAYNANGEPLDVERMKSTLEMQVDAMEDNTAALASYLTKAANAAPTARTIIAERQRRTISEKIGPRCYRQPEAGTIDRTHARAVKAEIASAAPALGAATVAELRGQLCRQARHARQYQAQERERRTRETERAAALAAVTEAAKAYAAIYAQYSEAARTWALSATSDAWATEPEKLWTVRYGAAKAEADEDGETYRSAPQEIVISSYSASLIYANIERGIRIHKIERIEYDGSTQQIIVIDVIDLTPYDYGTISTTRPMAYCHAYSAQPAGYFVNIPFGRLSHSRPPQPPALAEDWEEFCTRTTGRSAPQTWRAYLDQGDPYANSIPF